MQKKIIALAVAAMASGAVMAQSNVTIYGVLDASGYYNHSKGAGTTYGFASNNYQSSQLGFKGTEDLGGGLSTFFKLEEEVTLATGNQGSSLSGAGAPLGNANNGFNRAANVGLAGGFGSLTLGRQATPTFAALPAVDAFMMNSGGFANAWAKSNLLTLKNQVTGLGDVSSNTSGGILLPGSFAAGIAYTTPSFSGLKATLFVNAGNGNTGATYSSNGIRDLGVSYDNGPIVVRFNTSRTNNNAAYNLATQSWQSVIAESKTNLLGGSYNFGSFKATAAWSKTTFDASLAATNHDTRLWTLGGTYMASPALRLGVSYTDLSDTTASANKGKNTSFLADYYLSKRTNVYALVSSVKNDGLASLTALWGGNTLNTTTGSNLDGRNGTNTSVALGLRHTF